MHASTFADHYDKYAELHTAERRNCVELSIGLYRVFGNSTIRGISVFVGRRISTPIRAPAAAAAAAAAAADN